MKNEKIRIAFRGGGKVMRESGGARHWEYPVGLAFRDGATAAGICLRILLCGRQRMRGQSTEIRPSRMAYLARSATPWQSSFFMRTARCVSTVLVLTCRLAAIRLVFRPSANS
jgi:hypothetical protein